MNPAPAPLARPPVRRFTIGPGLLFALSMMGPGDLVSNVTIGATRGYRLLWLLVVVLAFRYVWLNTTARYVLATGETLLAGYARRSRWIPRLVFASLIVSRHASNLYKIALMGAAASLLVPLPVRSSDAIWSLVFAGLGLFLMTRDVRTLERVLRPVIALLGAALIAAAILAHPDVPAIARGLVVPSLPAEGGTYSSLLLVTALIGAEAGALVNVSYSYFMYQKGWRDPSWIPRQRLDLLFSVGCIFLLGALLQVAAAGTLLPAHLVPQNAEHLVQVFIDTLGVAGRVIFAFGLWAVCFSGFVAGTTGYSLIGADFWLKTGWPRPGAGEPQADAAPPDAAASRRVRRWLVVFWAVSPLYILVTHVQPVWLVLAVSSLTVLLMPALCVALLVITNDRRLMGRYANHAATNIMLGVMVLVTLYLSVRNAIDLLPHG
jgi:Mn2+/Fe2+ NRAMP family transporter